MKLSIIIPAHNEEFRIGKTLEAYHAFFKARPEETGLSFELVAVLNGCSDNTAAVVRDKQKLGNIIMLDLPTAGKGYALKAGFMDALQRTNDLIGFVDADMATQPQYFYELVQNIGTYDGIIASRYMPGAQVFPPRPAYKRWGSALIYESLVWLLFGMNYHDYQCGAKLFKRHTLGTITPLLTERQWAFDVELLYLCKMNHFKILEWPTTWYDQTGSKLTLKAGFRMLKALIRLRWHHTAFSRK